ncbi:sigma-70 family RNA polymerase sigma factor [Legionella parisiensis]|uniref:ECF RNA polymerase sigma-E factor n=1 Tax=Legionella parisiensis TaxID=45071 RepID=A0A1E5JNP4_9GAMM|nr:sigma-70 family RNA polymerase sigma factor [Legionella parisiensis]KTD41401.1 Sigma factor RpoE (sigma 24) [Legionella parisiensis]OEH46149.1 ECF RNA polymerase sigma-E factor [Legionella parisiensis]STX76296.1 Sigma factor RpoE (sigma 24) [Legionella parisiensis]
MNKETSYSDEDLINLARQGEMEAYNLLFSRYNNKIQQIIYLHIQDRANVSDLAQEVLIKVYRYLHYFKKKSQFSTWLYRITQNTIKNHYRAANLRMDMEAEYADNYYPSVQLSPEYLLINIEFGEQLESILSTLSEELRLCYGMYILDGKSYEDIAKKMDCPVGTVRSRIFRARKLIMESIGQFV